MIGWRVDRRKTKDSGTDAFRSSFQIQPKSVIKESLQNSQDVPAKISKKDLLNKTFFDYSDSETVHVTYQILEIKGKAKTEYLEALNIDSFKIYLISLIKTLENSHKREEKELEILKLKNSLKLMEKGNTEPIYLLNVVDKNTLGLIGNKNASVPPLNFKNFNLSVADSEKAQGGGSWAVGKIAFTTCSNINTLLNCSNLTEPQIVDGKEKKLRRLYGVSLQKPSFVQKQFLDEYNNLKNPENDQDEHIYYDNTWLFGDVTSELNDKILPPINNKVTDYFDESRLVTSKLLIDVLDDSETGTVVQVPFFNMEYKKSIRKSRKSTESLEEIANEFIEICSELAWESLFSKKLKIEVEYGTVTNGTIRNTKLHKVDIIERLKTANDGAINHYLELSNGIKHAIKSNQLDDGIEIATEEKTSYFLNDIDIFIDDLDKSEKQFKYNPHLALNVFNREDNHKLPKEFQNKIAIMRSPGLIIELKELNHGNSQKIVFGILYLGTSLIASEINKKAENYYRLSEDKAHNSIFTPGQENLLNKGYYKDEKRKPMSVSDLLKQTWTPIEERVNSLLIIEDETKGKRYFELERMLKLTAEPEKEESYLLIPEPKANSKNRILQPVAVPKNSKLYITNKSAKPASLIGEMLGSGTIKISEVKEYENSFCSIELRGNDLIISNETNNDQKVIFEVIYESSTNLGNRFVALTPNIKAEKV